MIKTFETEIDGVRFRTKTLPASKAIIFTEVIDEILPKVFDVFNITGKAQDAIEKEIPGNVDELTEALKKNLGSEDVSTLVSKVCDIMKWRQNGNLIGFMAGQEPHSNCAGGILENTEIFDGEFRGINFDDDFSGSIELAFKVVVWVVKTNYPFILRLLSQNQNG